MLNSRLTDEQLAESIRKLGVLTPGLKWHGVLLDGRRRSRLCAALGVRFPCTDVVGLAEAASALFQTEPARAVERFGVARGAAEFARLIGVRRGQVAPYFPRTSPAVGSLAEHVETVSLRIPIALREALETYCAEHDIGLSTLIRNACEKKLRGQRRKAKPPK